MNSLAECPNCSIHFARKNVVVTKVYTNKHGIKTHIQYCIRKGCGYRVVLFRESPLQLELFNLSNYA